MSRVSRRVLQSGAVWMVTMRFLFWLAALVGICALPLSSQSSEYPNFNGTWVLQAKNVSEVYTFDHNAIRMHVVQRINDAGGQRTIEFAGGVDGLPHRSTVDGDSLIFRAQWFGDSLIWETRREHAGTTFYNRRIMKLAGHDEIRALRTRILPAPEASWDEVWLRQAGQ